jgi:hypothetical protein
MVAQVLPLQPREQRQILKEFDLRDAPSGLRDRTSSRIGKIWRKKLNDCEVNQRDKIKLLYRTLIQFAQILEIETDRCI